MIPRPSARALKAFAPVFAGVKDVRRPRKSHRGQGESIMDETTDVVARTELPEHYGRDPVEFSGDAFSRDEPGIFAPLPDALLAHGDHYMHLADLKSYLEADRAVCALYRDGDEWAHKANLNVAGPGQFSSDRTIAQCAAEIWHAKPCPVR
jgi:hypothetical protein